MDGRREILRAYAETILRGVHALLPVTLTVFVLTAAWGMVDSIAGAPATAVLRWALGRPALPRWAGTLAAIPALVLVCIIVGGTVGSAVLRVLEDAALRLPVVGGIYRLAKAVVDRLSEPPRVTERLRRGVVLFPFGHGGAHAVGLLVGSRLQQVPTPGAEAAFTVFVSHVPTTVTGFLVLTREREIANLEGWSIEDFARYYASGGIVAPACAVAARTGGAAPFPSSAPACDAGDAPPGTASLPAPGKADPL